MSTEDDLWFDTEDDDRAIAFIRNYLPQELKGKFTDDDMFYFMDLLAEYYSTSGCLDVEPDEEGYINIDEDEIVQYLLTESKKDGMDRFTEEELLFFVQGEMEYGNSMFDEINN